MMTPEQALEELKDAQRYVEQAISNHYDSQDIREAKQELIVARQLYYDIMGNKSERKSVVRSV